jgi:hypothetical protein
MLISMPLTTLLKNQRSGKELEISSMIRHPAWEHQIRYTIFYEFIFIPEHGRRSSILIVKLPMKLNEIDIIGRLFDTDSFIHLIKQHILWVSGSRLLYIQKKNKPTLCPQAALCLKKKRKKYRD